MSIASKISALTSSRDSIRLKMVAAGQANSSDKLATLATNLTIPNTSDATATASDIIAGKTAYVNNVKVTGTLDVATSADIQAILNGTYGGA